MKNNFQLITIVVFIAGAVIGLLVFSGAIPLGGDKADKGQGTVVIWGTIRAGVVNPLLEELNNLNQTFLITYEEKNPDTFDKELLEALASGSGPDMYFLPDNLVYHYGNKVLPVPYSSFSLANYQGSFVSASDVFLTPSGISAFPIFVDPMVMFYDRNILDTNNVVYPPRTWDDLVSLVPTLTVKDNANRISKNTIALGHSSNISNYKDILSMMFLQSGSKVVKFGEGRYVSDLDSNSNASMLDFYTGFADPQKSGYSWNKSFPDSRDYFSTGNLAFYLGYASDLSSLVNKNPNQNILVAEVPQLKDATFKATMAHVTGLAISAFSKNQNTAFIVLNQLTSGNFAAKLSQNLGVAPARRDLLNLKPNDAYFPVFYNSALFARSWLDPSPTDTDVIFSNMINGVLSNSLKARDAVSAAAGRLSLLLSK